MNIKPTGKKKRTSPNQRAKKFRRTRTSTQQLIHSQTKPQSKKFQIPQQVNNLENKKKFQNAKFPANAKTKSPANPNTKCLEMITDQTNNNNKPCNPNQRT